MTKMLWRDVTITDLDGNPASDEDRVRALAEYRRTNQIGGFFLCDQDDRHRAGCAPADQDDHSQCGPSIEDIDWRGFPLVTDTTTTIETTDKHAGMPTGAEP
jgi:hypothetical protein